MKKLLFVSFVLLLVLKGYSQHTNILIDDDQTGYDPCEPSIIINPENPNHIVAGAIINRYYYSTNAGYSWSKGLLDSPFGVWGDPCIIVDTNSSYHYLHLSNPPSGNWIDRIVSQKADQIGDEWNEGTYMGLNGNKAQDKAWAVIDRTNNNIYVTWTQFDQYGSSNPDDESNIHFSKSTDGGITWSDAKQINIVPGDCVDDDNTVEGAVPAVGPDNQIYVSWAGPAGIVFNKSYDEGETWMDEEAFISDIPGGWAFDIPGISRCNGMPVTKCDLSGGIYNGTIYVNWSDQRNGTGDTDIWLVKSLDEGQTWSDPVRVNNDPPGKQQFFTWMDIDQATGNLWFVWYDRRNYDNENTDVYMAVSYNGGESFVNFKVSESPFLPSGSYFFGDYTNISAYNNIIRPIWTRLHNGILSIWTAIVDPGLVGIERLETGPFAEQHNYPNPFMESTVISFKLTEPTLVTLKISDVLGNIITVFYNSELLQTGKYTITFDPAKLNLPSGVYFFSLSDKTSTFHKKMLYTP